MMLSEILTTTISTTAATGEWHDPTFAEFGTVSFEPEIMRKSIGFGTAIIDPRTGEFAGFVSYLSRGDTPVGPILGPYSMNLYPWLMMVPDAYREDVEVGAVEVFDRSFYNRQITSAVIGEYIAEMRQWIGSHVIPTTEHLPRSVRWANAWREVGIYAALAARKITRAAADEMMRGELTGDRREEG